MSGSGIMQLVAYGTHDAYLTGNSQITFFKSTYARHTNYALESINRQPRIFVDHGCEEVYVDNGLDNNIINIVEFTGINLNHNNAAVAAAAAA
jgi:hypothetical protein